MCSVIDFGISPNALEGFKSVLHETEHTSFCNHCACYYTFQYAAILKS